MNKQVLRILEIYIYTYMRGSESDSNQIEIEKEIFKIGKKFESIKTEKSESEFESIFPVV